MEKYINKLIGELSGLTKNEQEEYKISLKNEMKRLQIKKLLKEGDKLSTEQEWIWKANQDKLMLMKLFRHMSKTIHNYRRKIYGWTNMPDQNFVSEVMQEMMKEALTIRYPNWKAIDVFWGESEYE